MAQSTTLRKVAISHTQAWYCVWVCDRIKTIASIYSSFKFKFKIDLVVSDKHLRKHTNQVERNLCSSTAEMKNGHKNTQSSRTSRE